jgi:CHAD domain-containing protein
MESKRKRAPRVPTLAALVKRAVGDTLTTFSAGAGAYSRSPSGDELHDVRVASRRVSAVAALFHGFPAKGDGSRIERVSNDLRRALSTSREREVAASLLRGLSGNDAEQAGRALSALQLDDGKAGPDIAPDAERLEAALAAWSDQVARWRPRPEQQKALRKKVRRRLKSERRRVLDLGIPGKRTLHRQRIAAKALRYSLEIVVGVEKNAAALVAASKKVQDALGDANDWAALLRLLRQTRSATAGEEREALEALLPTVKESRKRALEKARLEVRRYLRLLGRTSLDLASSRN